MKIDILGKAPSIYEIDKYNKILSKKKFYAENLALFLFVFGLICIPMSVFIWGPSNIYMYIFIASQLGSLILFFVATMEGDKVKEFISLSVCEHLLSLINKYPEVAAYRNQVVAQNRPFLQSEYEAWILMLEKRECCEVYAVNYK